MCNHINKIVKVQLDINKINLKKIKMDHFSKIKIKIFMILNNLMKTVNKFNKITKVIIFINLINNYYINLFMYIYIGSDYDYNDNIFN